MKKQEFCLVNDHLIKGVKMFNEKKLILFSFLLVYGLKTLYSLIYFQEDINLLFIRILGLLLFLLISFTAYYKANSIALICMAVIIFLTGVGSLCVAGFISFEQSFLKIIFIIIGGFFTYGGIKLFIIEKRFINRH